MEKELEKSLEDILGCDGVYGCLLADSHGLFICGKGKYNPDSSGMIRAVACQAAKLEPNSETPVILLEGSNRQCLIQQRGRLTTGIYKNITH